MKTAILLSSLLMTIFSIPAMAGGDSGGGVSVFCSGDISRGFAKDGHYSLDYALTAKSNRQNELSAKSAEAQLDEIANGLQHIPEIAKRFKLYRENLANSLYWDASHRYVWTDAAAPLMDTNDQKLDRLLPENCRSQKNADGSVVLKQVTVRKPVNKNVINFEIQDERLQELKANSPLQLSYHYVHEFLRDFTDDASIIRRVNRLFHDPEFSKLSEAALIQNLASMGLGQFNGASDIEKAQVEKTCLTAMIPKSVLKDEMEKFVSHIVDYANSSMDSAYLPDLHEEQRFSCYLSDLRAELTIVKQGDGSFGLHMNFNPGGRVPYEWNMNAKISNDGSLLSKKIAHYRGVPGYQNYENYTADEETSIRIDREGTLTGMIKGVKRSDSKKTKPYLLNTFQCRPKK